MLLWISNLHWGVLAPQAPRISWFDVTQVFSKVVQRPTMESEVKCWQALETKSWYNKKVYNHSQGGSTMIGVPGWPFLAALEGPPFQTLSRVWMHEEKHWTAQRQLETLFILVAASQFLVSQSDFLMNKKFLFPNSYLKVVFNWLLTWK